MPSRIVRYHHVTHNISRSNIAAARHFYGDLLGLTELSPMGDPTNQRLIWFQVGDQQLHLVLRDRTRTEEARHLAVLVEGFDEIVACLEGEGIPFDELVPGQKWGVRPDGAKYAFCYDPDFNRIELMEV
jgi:catechol 2,3-dioxygenase-like lactoylglutathione lyase family enzyme